VNRAELAALLEQEGLDHLEAIADPWAIKNMIVDALRGKPEFCYLGLLNASGTETVNLILPFALQKGDRLWIEGVKWEVLQVRYHFDRRPTKLAECIH